MNFREIAAAGVPVIRDNDWTDIQAPIILKAGLLFKYKLGRIAYIRRNILQVHIRHEVLLTEMSSPPLNLARSY